MEKQKEKLTKRIVIEMTLSGWNLLTSEAKECNLSMSNIIKHYVELGIFHDTTGLLGKIPIPNAIHKSIYWIKENWKSKDSPKPHYFPELLEENRNGK